MNPKDAQGQTYYEDYWYGSTTDGLYNTDEEDLDWDDANSTNFWSDNLRTVIEKEKKKSALLAKHMMVSKISETQLKASSISYPPVLATSDLYGGTDEAALILERLSEMTFESVAGMSPWDHLSAEDAGGQYIISVMQAFATNIRIFLRKDNSVDNLLYMESKDETLFQTTDKLDTSDKYDILMSFYGEEEAESIEPEDLLLRFDKLVASIVRPLWRHLRDEVS